MERTEGAAVRLARTDTPGEAPAVLALHGLASSRRWWRLVAERSRHRVVAADLRGHGESSDGAGGFGFAAVAGDVLALADELEIDRFVAAGHSWGASVALWLAAEHPERVLACVCVDGGLGDLRRRFPGGWAEAEVAMRPPDLVGVRRRHLQAWAAGPLAAGSDPDTVLDILLGSFEPVGGDGGSAVAERLRPRLSVDQHMQIARELFELDSASLLARVRVPVTGVLAREPGGAWQEQREDGARRAAEIAGERLRVTWVEGGHDLPVQRPDQVAAILDEAAEAAG